jgi:hypothetical protein
MKLNLNIEVDDDKVFGNIPEAERTDEMRDYVRSGLEDFYGTDDDNAVTEALLGSACGEIDTYLNQVRGEGREIPMQPTAAEGEV